MDKILLCCCCLASALFASPSANTNEVRSAVQDARPETADLKPIFVRLGDRLELTDAYHPEELKATELVASDGTVLLPELGPVQVAGLRRDEVVALLMEKYSEYYDHLDLQVRIVPARKSFFLFGEVADNGPREFEGDMTIWEAVMLNRPDMRTANLGSVRLIRPDPLVPAQITVDIARMNATGDSSLNVHVQEGDLVYVPRAFSVPELLAQAGAGMEVFAQSASAQDAERVRQLVAELQAISAEFERLAR